jgi:two-component system response regulator AtoC
VDTETTIREESETAGGRGAQLHLLVMSFDAFFSRPLPDSGAVKIGRSSKCDLRIDDPLASRDHAQIQIAPTEGVPTVSITDLGSVNGTRVRDVMLTAGQPVTILAGDAVTIGSTMMMVLQDRPPGGPRRLWSHADFETRMQGECARAAETGVSVALARIRFTGVAPWTAILPIFVRDLPAPHVFAGYGPKDYEILFIGVEEGEAERLVESLLATCRAAGMDGSGAVAWYPRDGRSVDALLARANALLKAPPGNAGAAGGGADGALVDFVGMQLVREMATRAASSAINVLILGETGVGKEILAQLIHRMSPRADEPFVALNCAGLPQSLIESELFGHERGAFTGAASAKVGLLESATGGTVFLDEIGEMPLAMQAALLRVIEAREIMPVGAVRPRPINVRFVSATNRDLEGAAAKGQFRSDLLFRLNVMTLVVPPLRERIDEIPALMTTFVASASREAGRADALRVAPAAMDLLMRYTWPGNIRELKNVLERAVVLCDGPEITLHHLPLEKMGSAAAPPPTPEAPPGAAAATAMVADADTLPTLADPKKAAERKRIVDALAECASNQTRAAHKLGMPRRTFVSKLDYYGIPRPQKGHAPEKGS